MRKKKSELTEPFDMPNSLLTAVIKLLEKDKRTFMEIYKDTGIPFYWLQALSKGKFMNPSVNRVQYLYEQLSGKKLSL